MSETIKQWVGIDVSQDNLDIAIYPQNSTWRVTNDEVGRAELVSKLAAHQIAGIVLEATGGLDV
jgi:transposase